MYRAIAVVFTSCLATFGIARAQNLQPTHGTINIILANQHGLVAETDSRLSHNNKPVGKGQKLFRIDDHTVCTIAGFYKDPGPPFGNYDHPAFTLVPQIFRHYLSSYPRWRDTSIEKKISSIASLFIWSMELVGNVDRVAGIPINSSDSHIIVSGFEDGQTKVDNISLYPIVQNQRLTYEVTAAAETVVSEGFTHLLSGFCDAAKDVLSNPQRYLAEPVIRRYSAAIAADSGASLSLNDLRELADHLEELTARKYPGVVGDERQVAMLSQGVIVSFEQPLPSEPSRGRTVAFHQESDNAMRGSRFHPFGLAFFATPTAAVLVTHSYASDSIVSLDNFIFSGSTFERVTLVYDGSPLALFDDSNVLNDCVLKLGQPVGPNNACVRKLTIEYPHLPVIPHHSLGTHRR